LKAALDLTDAQLQQLIQLQTNYYQSNQTLYNQLSEKQRIVYEQMSAENPDAVAAGNAVVAIAALNKQLKTADKQYRDSAKAVLTAAQRPKLQALDDARKLQTPIWQATSLGLLEGYGLIAFTGDVPNKGVALPAAPQTIPCTTARPSPPGVPSTLMCPGN